jgi:hypothetical protein
MVDSSKKGYISRLNILSWIFGKFDLGGLIMSIILTIRLIPPTRKKSHEPIPTY